MNIPTTIGNLKVSSGFNIYIDVTEACNARCPFCIAPTVGRHNGHRFFDGIDYALDLVNQVNGTLQIVGGEPTISNRIHLLLEKIGKYQIRRVVLNTNAAGLSHDLVRLCADSGVTYINISRHHYNENRNQGIMLQKPMLPNYELQRKALYVLESGISLRLQCNLISGEIDTFSEMQNYMDWGKKLGCDTFSFSQLFPLSVYDYQVAPVENYTESHQVDLCRIVREIDSDKQYWWTRGPLDATSHGGGEGTIWGARQPTDAGVTGRRRFWNKNGIEFSVKTLSGYDKDMLPMPTVYSKADDGELAHDTLSFAVVQADGVVSASWDRRERVLYSPYVTIENTVEVE
jgi:pyruvate-formate lyase-activating enzyme